MCKYENVRMCKCANVQIVTFVRLRTCIAGTKGDHLHICTFSHLHICTFAH